MSEYIAELENVLEQQIDAAWIKSRIQTLHKVLKVKVVSAKSGLQFICCFALIG